MLFDFLLTLPQDLRYAELIIWAEWTKEYFTEWGLDGAYWSINSRFCRLKKLNF